MPDMFGGLFKKKEPETEIQKPKKKDKDKPKGLLRKRNEELDDIFNYQQGK